MTVDTLITRYQMDNSNYVANAREVDVATMRNQRSMEGLSRGIMAATGIVTAFIGAVTGAAFAIGALGVAAFQRSAEFDAMVKGLEAIEGSADKAAKAVARLREIASRPGLGLEEAIRGYSGLRRNDVEPELAFRILSGAGNANALAGGGRAELEQILRAFTQIAQRPNLSGEELNQLNEAGVPGSKIINDAFGTFDGAELKKQGVDSRDALLALVEGMEKMPIAADSAKNSLENLNMAWELALVGIGDGLATHLLGPVQDLAAAIATLEAEGAFEIIGDQLGAVTMSAFPNLEGTTQSLDDTMFELSLVVLDVAEALRNMKLNIDDAINPIKTGVGVADIVTGGIAGELMGTDLPTARELAIRDREIRQNMMEESNRFARELGYKDRDEMLAAREGASEDEKENAKSAAEPKMMIDLTKEIARNTRITAEALRGYVIGSSVTGEASFNSVNLNGFSRRRGGGGGMVSILENRILDEISANNRTVGY